MGKKIAYVYKAKTLKKGSKYRVSWGKVRQRCPVSRSCQSLARKQHSRLARSLCGSRICPHKAIQGKFWLCAWWTEHCLDERCKICMHMSDRAVHAVQQLLSCQAVLAHTLSVSAFLCCTHCLGSVLCSFVHAKACMQLMIVSALCAFPHAGGSTPLCGSC